MTVLSLDASALRLSLWNVLPQRRKCWNRALTYIVDCWESLPWVVVEALLAQFRGR